MFLFYPTNQITHFSFSKHMTLAKAYRHILFTEKLHAPKEMYVN